MSSRQRVQKSHQCWVDFLFFVCGSKHVRESRDLFSSRSNRVKSLVSHHQNLSLISSSTTLDVRRSILSHGAKTISIQRFLGRLSVSIDLSTEARMAERKKRGGGRKRDSWPLRRYTFLEVYRGIRSPIQFFFSRSDGPWRKRTFPLFDSNSLSSIDASHSRNYSLKKKEEEEEDEEEGEKGKKKEATLAE